MSYIAVDIYFLYTDNDKPVVTASKDSPVEGVDIVTLTCSPSTSDNVTGYVWYRNNVQIPSATNMTYALPKNARVDDGDYTCEVITYKVPTSPMSDNLTMTFLCKMVKIPLYRSHISTEKMSLREITCSC